MKTHSTKSLLTLLSVLLINNIFAQPCTINQQTVSYSGPTCVSSSFTDNITLMGSETGVSYSLNVNGNTPIGLPQLGTGGPLNFSTGSVNEGTTIFNVNAQSVDPTFQSLLFSGSGALGAVNPSVVLGNAISSVFANTHLITVEAWVFPTSNGNNDPCLIVGNTGSNGSQFRLRIQDLYPAFDVFLSTNFNNGNGVIGPQLSLNTWSHIAATWDGATLRLFINGLETSNTSATGNFPAISADSYIASQNDSYFFDGNISDVRIWSVARSPLDIITNKNKCIDPASSGLLAYYKMSDGAGSNTLTDATGNGYNGTLTNMNPNSDWTTNVPVIGCGCILQMGQQVTVAFSTVVGDANCSFSIDNGEISGDINGDGSIGVGEVAGDLNGNGIIGGGELAGDITGDTYITNSEIPGDINGNGIIDGTEIQGDYNGNGVIGLDDNFVVVSGFEGVNAHLNGLYNYDGIVNGKPSFNKLATNGGDCSAISSFGENFCNFDTDTWILWDNTKWKFFANLPQCQWEALFSQCVPAAGADLQTYIDSLAYISNNTNSYYPPCGVWPSPGFQGTAIISGPCRNTPSTQNITGNTTICRSGIESITVSSTETNTLYYLRNNSNNAIIAGPVAGTGSTITFSTGLISANTTYNVYANNIGDSTNFNIQMPNLITISVNQPTVVGDADCDGTIGAGEIAGDVDYNGTIDNGETAGDSNGNGTIDNGETAGDSNGNGTIDNGETAGDSNGNGTINNGETAGDSNGNGTIDNGETAGDSNGNGTINNGETSGDSNGNGTIDNGETADTADLQATEEIKVYPNPSSGIFIAEGFGKGVKLDVVNAVGELVMSITVTNAKTKIDLSSMPAGTYSISTEVNGIIVTKRIVKK